MEDITKEDYEKIQEEHSEPAIVGELFFRGKRKENVKTGDIVMWLKVSDVQEDKMDVALQVGVIS